MKTCNLLIIFISLIVFSCNESESDKDATGVFEATEIVVSAEGTGKILSLSLHDGQPVKKGEILGQIDTIQLSLKRMQVKTNQLSLQAGKPDIDAQIGATIRELDQLEFEKNRLKRLFEGEVATQKQLDDNQARIDVLKARLNAQRKNLNSNTDVIDAQYEALGVQREQINDQIERCTVRSPIDGIILVKYAEEGEFVTTGKPLFKVADMSQMILRAYVTGEQLKEITVGKPVQVLAEFGAESTTAYEGEITWISEKSEFTPKTIQTREERAHLVYAVKVAVKNDGNLKIGMYGGVKWEFQ